MPAQKKKTKSQQIKKREASKISRPPKRVTSAKAASASLKKSAPKPPKTHPGVPIVGIGASAGGLEALELLFSHMPPETNPYPEFACRHLSVHNLFLLTGEQYR